MLVMLFVFAAWVSAQGAPEAEPSAVDRAWTVLKDGLDSKNPDHRARAVHALALLPKNRKAEEWAENALADQSPDVRMEAATALGQMGAFGAKPKLKDALKDREIKVVVAAANALYLLKDPAAYDVYYALLTGELKGPGALQSQLATFKNRKDVEKLAFETGIGFVPFGGMGYEAWKRLTEDATTPVRIAAIEKLATDPDPKTSQALKQSCSDKKWQVRAASADAIAKRGDPGLLDGVTPLLLDENDAVRSEAAAATIRLSAPPSSRRSAKKPAH